MRICVHCGLPNDDSAVNCAGCGTILPPPENPQTMQPLQMQPVPMEPMQMQPMPMQPMQMPMQQGPNFPRRKRRIWIWIIVILLVCGGVGILIWQLNKNQSETSTTAPADSTIVNDEYEEYEEDEFDEMDEQEETEYSPEQYAINAGDQGGKWENMESGETAYVFPSGEYARNQWVRDGGELYYVDASGCLMINNYSHDGCYVGSDGTWNPQKPSIKENTLPRNGAVYTDDSGKTLVFSVQEWNDGTIRGKAHLDYPAGIDYSEDFEVYSFGHSAYRLSNINDEFSRWHVVVLNDGRTVRMSGVGETDVYEVNQ